MFLQTKLATRVHKNGQAQHLLNSFCQYQADVNPGSDLTNPRHWDHAILLTGFVNVDFITLFSCTRKLQTCVVSNYENNDNRYILENFEILSYKILPIRIRTNNITYLLI